MIRIFRGARPASARARASASFGPAAPAFCSAAFILAACMGGTGTDTDNGLAESGWHLRFEDGDGVPQAGVTVLALPADWIPTGPAAAAESSWPTASVTATTSEEGWARLPFAEAGDYRVEVLGPDGASLGFAGLSVTDTGRSDTLRLSRQPSRNLQGTLVLASGLTIDSGKVFLRGTRHAARVDAFGFYDLGALAPPAEAWTLELSYRARPLVIREIDGESTVRKDAQPGLVVAATDETPCADPVAAEWSDAPGGARCVEAEAGDLVVVKAADTAGETPDQTFVSAETADAAMPLALVPASCVEGLDASVVVELPVPETDDRAEWSPFRVEDIRSDCP